VRRKREFESAAGRDWCPSMVSSAIVMLMGRWVAAITSRRLSRWYAESNRSRGPDGSDESGMYEERIPTIQI